MPSRIPVMVHRPGFGPGGSVALVSPDRRSHPGGVPVHLIVTLLAAALSSSVYAGVEPESVCLPDHLDSLRAYERSILEAVSTDRLRAMHERLASEPHRAGTPGDRRVIALIADHFNQLGLEVEIHEFSAYLAEPVSAYAELVSPVRRTLELKETPLEEDPDTQRVGLSSGWNAYSGSGDVSAEVVYVNRGTLEDFNTLREMGVSLRGKIAIARYGGNFRGFKAKYAQEAGAVGLFIYTDPADSGYARGPMWPEGGWANPTTIQRGSIMALEYPGDPLTPARPAEPGVVRLDPRDVDLPKIPVQPIGWGAAQEILSRLDGTPVPDASWQGALPFPYRVTGEGVVARLSVMQRRHMVSTANVIGTLHGTDSPDEVVLIGSHHDAWEYGAQDPLGGTIATLECATLFGELAKAGRLPARSIAFAAWGAEEFGIIGSTEWVEANREQLMREAVAYFNLDASSNGLSLGASASPSLKALIASVADEIPSPAAPGQSALGEWLARDGLKTGDPLRIGNLGGGSDHVGFYTHLGIPSAGIGAGGAQGSAYHSLYDTLAWYQSTVGNDYESSALVTRATALCAARLADASLLPVDLVAYSTDTLRHADTLDERAKELGVPLDLTPLRDAARRVGTNAEQAQAALSSAVASGKLDGEQLAHINALLLSFERFWLAPSGLTGSPWYRNLFASSDPTSGYAAWMLPEIRRAVEAKDEAAARLAVARTTGALLIIDEALKSLRALTP